MNKEYRDIISFDGTVLKCLVKETGSKRWLIVTHGLGEHSGRHEFFLKLFSQFFNIAIYDLRGHGRSSGKPAWVENFSDFSKDLGCVTKYLQKEFDLKDFQLFGHSMGGLITADFMQNHVQEDLYPEKVFFSSPAVGAPGVGGTILANSPKMLFELLKKLPSTPVAKVLDLKKLSHDHRVYESYIKDELNHLKIHTKLYIEVMKASREVFSRPLRIKCPSFCVVGTKDALVNSGLVIDYFTNVEKQTHLKIFKDGYHELHNEIEKFKTPYLSFLRQSLTGLDFESV